ncbi:hypothetical protein GCM10023165_38680 [Variovorax defluvii]|uniref:AB hydrolase-1 domain-containing protein n=2 Tax=Variovorax defluvii TaxID=913761 RepID=A0ABP8I4A5_9BURK
MAWLLAASAWFVNWWPQAPAVAVGGLLILSTAHAGVLGVEFIATRRVSRSDSVARASAFECGRAWIAESWIAARVFCWQQPFRSRAFPDHLPQANGRRGVIFVHGFLCNRAFWNPWLEELRARDHAFVAVNLEPIWASIDHYVQTIESAVQRVTAQTGRAPVLICHSMGGLAARAWLRSSDPSRVHRIVTIGTPHHGTWLARFSHTANGRQMRIGSNWMRQAERDGVPAGLFTCWYSNCDNITFPVSTATLPGADNRLASGRGHVEMAFMPSLRHQTLDLLES